MSTFTLPTEIWLLICKQLCPHCMSDEMPDFQSPGYKAGKSALHALSLTSRATRDLSQPFMYHCFYQTEYQDNCAMFLRTIVTKPQLAEHVRVLSLPGKNSIGNGFEYGARRDFESWRDASSNIGIPTPGWVSEALSGTGQPDMPTFNGGNQDSQLEYPGPRISPFDRWIRKDVIMWQQLLTIAHCNKGLTHLAMHQICGPGEYATRSRRTGHDASPKPRLEQAFNFPHLHVLSIQQAHHRQDVYWFVSQAPCLSYVGVGFLAPVEDVPASASWAPPQSLASVKALSISCSSFEQGYLLRLCNQIKDLEIHLPRPLGPSDSLSEWEAARMASLEVLDAWPASVKQGLRRLRLSSEAGFTGPRNERVTPGNHDEEMSVVVSPPLAEFSGLEVLETDQTSLNVCLMRGMDHNTTPEEVLRQLPTGLPSSLQVLRIFHSDLLPWSLLLLELDELASAKRGPLPRLSVIQIDLDLHPPHFRQGLPATHRRLPDAMRLLGVVSAMKDAGIELRFTLDGLFSYVHGFRTPLPGCFSGFSLVSW